MRTIDDATATAIATAIRNKLQTQSTMSTAEMASLISSIVTVNDLEVQIVPTITPSLNSQHITRESGKIINNIDINQAPLQYGQTIIPVSANHEPVNTTKSPDSPFIGFASLGVYIDNHVDSNIQSENIKKGVKILGTTGTLQTEPDNGFIPTSWNSNGNITSGTTYGTTVPSNCFRVSGSITISNGTLTINQSAFYNQQYITSVLLPNTLKTIENGAFYNCLALTSITIPASVTTIGGAAFSGCSNLTTITFECTNPSLQSNTFHNCTSATSVSVPQGFASSLNISYSTNLTQASLEALIDNLVDLTGQTAQTLTIGATNIAKLSQTYLDKITNKNWAYA